MHTHDKCAHNTDTQKKKMLQKKRGEPSILYKLSFLT